VARIFAWCDSPTAPTGFGRSAKHVLHALHEAGHELVQLAVNHDPSDPASARIPWPVFHPTDRGRDPYGMRDLGALLATRRFEALWTTFDPEVPFRYGIADGRSALQALVDLKASNPGFAMLGWFPIDGGPLSDLEMAQLGCGPHFDVTATMAPHVFDLMEWTLKLKHPGSGVNIDPLRKRLLVIPHGVELDTYRIATPEQRAAAKVRMGLDPTTFLVLQLERNQQRKQNYLALEVMERLFAANPKMRGRVVLFQHMLENEEDHASGLGFNLPELAWRYGLRAGQDVKWPGGFVPENVLHEVIYPAADAFLSVSTGEGFQYPAWEALACGIPLVVPDGDARRAWFKGVPNVHLYGMDERRLVMRGGYFRRMGYARPQDAANVLEKLVKRGGATQERREGGRAFVAKVADHRNVAAEWVRLVGEQVEKVRELRQLGNIADKFTAPEGVDALVKIPGDSIGVGDLVIVAPALQAVRRALNWQGRTLAVQVARERLDLARLLNVADQYVVEDVPAKVVADTAELKPPPRAPRDFSRWVNPEAQRTEFVREWLCQKFELATLPDMEPVEFAFTEPMRKQAAAKFLETFGVHPSECVGVAFESMSPWRMLPPQAALAACAQLKARGVTPVLLGQHRLDVRLVGVVNLTGGTDLLSLTQVVGQLGGLIGVDAAPLYLAAAQGVPVVGAFPTVSPGARLPYVGKGPRRALTPPEAAEHGGERFPAGEWPAAAPGEWQAYLTPALLVGALDEMLGTAPAAPELLLPTEAK
jgi:glycosyltransferase involved in cell wall biosynthesis